MTVTLLFGLLVFAAVTSITPGPNNLMLMTSGANFGFRRTLPHLAGVTVGFGLMNVIVGFGLGRLITEAPSLHGALQIAGTTYLLYLAWRIATSRGIGGGNATARPMRFLEAVAFQTVNVKAWTMSLGAFATYAVAGELAATIALITGMFVVVGIPCSVTWTAFGVGLKRALGNPRALRAFNIVMALLLVASLAPTAANALPTTSDLEIDAWLAGRPCSQHPLS